MKFTALTILIPCLIILITGDITSVSANSVQGTRTIEQSDPDCKYSPCD